MTKRTPLKVQSVLVDKDVYNLREAKSWIRKHDFRETFYGKGVEKTENFYRFRQAAPRRFKEGSYVTKEISEGVKLVLGNYK
jgi:hypothetical protein